MNLVVRVSRDLEELMEHLDQPVLQDKKDQMDLLALMVLMEYQEVPVSQGQMEVPGRTVLTDLLDSPDLMGTAVLLVLLVARDLMEMMDRTVQLVHEVHRERMEVQV